MIKAIVTVIGVDKVGIIAKVSNLLARHNVNILDITQTVMQAYFSMIMLVDVAQCDVSFEALKGECRSLGEQMGHGDPYPARRDLPEHAQDLRGRHAENR